MNGTAIITALLLKYNSLIGNENCTLKLGRP